MRPQAFVNLQPDGEFTFVKKVNLFEHIEYWIEPLYQQICIGLKKPLPEEYDSTELNEAAELFQRNKEFLISFYRLFEGRSGDILWAIEDILTQDLSDIKDPSDDDFDELENNRMDKWDKVMTDLVKRAFKRNRKNDLITLEKIITSQL